MTSMGKTIFAVGMACLLAVIWFAVRSDRESQPAETQTAQLTPVQRAELAPQPVPPKVAPPVARHQPPPDEDTPEDGNGS
jgi:hypothetical protein